MLEYSKKINLQKKTMKIRKMIERAKMWKTFVINEAIEHQRRQKKFIFGYKSKNTHFILRLELVGQGSMFNAWLKFLGDVEKVDGYSKCHQYPKPYPI